MNTYIKDFAQGLYLLIRSIGVGFLSLLRIIGQYTWFLLMILYQGVCFPWYGKQLSRQLVFMGFYSLPLTGLTALFSGMVLALQSYTAFGRFQAEQALPEVVVLSLTRELGPVLTGLMMAGRLGASIASEIASMQVTEQIDALVTLSTNPIRYLVFPRIIAAVLALPFLTLAADIIGVFGGYLVGVYHCHFSPHQYLHKTLEILLWSDVSSGLIKAAAFGFIVGFIGCYQGYHSAKGAVGVGRATTNGVVVSCIGILAANYVLTALLFS